jgi:hypothetical protein
MASRYSRYLTNSYFNTNTLAIPLPSSLCKRSTHTTPTCRVKSHHPLSCDSILSKCGVNIKSSKRNYRNMWSKTVTEALVRDCTKRRKFVLKEIGCSKMKCPCGNTRGLKISLIIIIWTQKISTKFHVPRVGLFQAIYHAVIKRYLKAIQ